MVEKSSQFSQGKTKAGHGGAMLNDGSKMGGGIGYLAEGGKARPAGFLRAHVTKKLL